MLSLLIKKIVGSQNERQLKQMRRRTAAIGEFENQLKPLDDAQLQARSAQLAAKARADANLNDLLPEAFAICREASRRVLGMRHFDVQLIGGMVLHSGKIAEMRTGEGKTLMATLPVYLNALNGKGVHVVTVNDYLARRDAEWMTPLYEFLGMSVGVVVPQQSQEEKRIAYLADITYGTNNEFGFDYLRDNMAFRMEDKCQRDLNFAVVDEVDSILIDEARTPLIISGPSEDSSELYRMMDTLAPKLVRQYEEADQEESGHFVVDEKSRQIELTEQGHQFVEETLTEKGILPEGESLYAAQNLNLLHHVQSALKAHVLFKRNVEYIVSGREVLLVDEHTGRTMHGRRLSEGLHQALEAKEGLPIQPESQTLASTTFQNYFRLYDTLSGMTGTADTEAYEFGQIYGLDVVVIPTHKPMIRNDMNDLVYLCIEDKYEAIIEDVRNTVADGRPVLVGTASIDASEQLSSALKKANIEHQVLNAKFHAKEAEIIAQAGRPGAVTIATNMAGRGTDIILGGNWEVEAALLDNPVDAQVEQIKQECQRRHDAVLAAGGLHIIGTERHESRRIDNQLRGRAGRQGDSGSSRFYLSLEDNLMRIFASDRVKNLMKVLGMESGEAIEHRMVTNAIEKAQRKVEGRNFDTRKQLLEYDDVANDQRKVIYTQRDELLAADDVSKSVANILNEVVDNLVAEHIPPESMEEQWDVKGLTNRVGSDLNEQLPIQAWLDQEDELDEEGLRQRILKATMASYERKKEMAGEAAMTNFERHILLRLLDEKWKEHLATMDHLRQGIHLRGYAAKNPKQEYKREAFELFSMMLDDIKQEVARIVCHVQVQDEPQEEMERRRQQLAEQMEFNHHKVSHLNPPTQSGHEDPQQAEPFIRNERKIGRNEPCPCGSGKKYKQCHGRIV